jgi:cyclic pyranopterin phosphate synthase
VNLVQIRSSCASVGAATDPLVDRVDRQVRYLRVSLTDRCNFRCTYCMPDHELDYGPRSEVLTLEEVRDAVAAFARWGITRVRLTGGEPTLRRGLVELVAELARLRVGDGDRSLEVVLTTNGDRLADLAEPLARAGLGAVTVSLDSLRADRFHAITRRGDLSRVLDGVDAARAAGLRPLKINVVAIRGFNDDELGALARFAFSREATPRFIEVMPMSGGELFVPGELMSSAEVRAMLSRELESELVPDDGAGVRGAGPASYWRVASGPHAGARVGTIGAMTENFCANCNRLRLSATGQLHGCLARDETGDLRAALRAADGKRLEAVVRAVLGTKRDGHGFTMDGAGGPHKAMVSIGG